MLPSKFKPLCAVALGVVLSMLAIPSYAGNGYSWVMTCAKCIATADYVAAANAQAVSLTQPGLFQVVSEQQATTAFIKVTGTIKTIMFEGYPEQVLRNVSGTPVDANGNSLAGLTETQQEATYGAIDLNLMMADRSDPLVISLTTGSATQDFVGTPDTAISVNVVNNAHLGAGIAAGTVVTVTFADGVVAEFIRTANTTPSDLIHWWVWNNVAHDAPNVCHSDRAGNQVCGGPVDRNGNAIPNQNSGGLGGGAISVHGFGSGANGTWGLSDHGVCYTTTQVTWGSWTSEILVSVVPC